MGPPVQRAFFKSGYNEGYNGGHLQPLGGHGGNPEFHQDTKVPLAVRIGKLGKRWDTTKVRQLARRPLRRKLSDAAREARTPSMQPLSEPHAGCLEPLPNFPSRHAVSNDGNFNAPQPDLIMLMHVGFQCARILSD